MVNVICDISFVNVDNYDFIRDCSAIVDAYVVASEFGDLDIRALGEIDGAELLDRGSGCVRTKFGLTDISNLSHGCKTVLSYLYVVRHKEIFKRPLLIEATECGRNALDVLFDMIDVLGDDETVVLVRHTHGLFSCKEHDYRLNMSECTRRCDFI